MAEVYIPGEISGKTLVFLKEVVMYTSYNNPGAIDCARKVQEAYPQLRLTNQPPKIVMKELEELEERKRIDSMAEQSVDLPLPPYPTGPEPHQA